MVQERSHTGRIAPLSMDPEEFRALGHECVDIVAGLLGDIASRPITRAIAPSEARKLVGAGALPGRPSPAAEVVRAIAPALLTGSLYNGHPRFLGYITSSPAPIGALADLLAAAVNPNVGSFVLSPVATAIEEQTIRWIAELIGYPVDAGGILVTGGNMANIVGFLAARRRGVAGDVRRLGLGAQGSRYRVYVSTEVHTWVEKAADIAGLGTDAIRRVGVGADQRMDADALEHMVADDLARGALPLMIIGTAGTVSTGAVDPLVRLSAIAKRHRTWFHVDGAYGAFAAALPDASADLKALALADSVAVDPHKWLYAPLECGCALVRDRELLRDTFHYHPSYYRFEGDPDDAPTNYYEFGPQNSRGFRALKVWMSMKQAGREGIVRMIADDIRLAGELHDALAAHPEIEVCTKGLSIVTFRYVPAGHPGRGKAGDEELDRLNTDLLAKLQEGGELFVSNAVAGGKALLRACIVNFRTSAEDVRDIPEIVARYGRAIAGATGARGA